MNGQHLNNMLPKPCTIQTKKGTVAFATVPFDLATVIVTRVARVATTVVITTKYISVA